MIQNLDHARIAPTDAARAAGLTPEQLERFRELMTPHLPPSMAISELFTVRHVMVLAAAKRLLATGS